MSVPSPCIYVCRIDPRSGWCEGCLRTLDEIALWGSLDGGGRLAISRLLPARRRTRDAECLGTEGPSAEHPDSGDDDARLPRPS